LILEDILFTSRDIFQASGTIIHRDTFQKAEAAVLRNTRLDEGIDKRPGRRNDGRTKAD
jgi:hypothetical protein